jgi:hypothetical protein
MHLFHVQMLCSWVWANVNIVKAKYFTFNEEVEKDLVPTGRKFLFIHVAFQSCKYDCIKFLLNWNALARRLASLWSPLYNVVFAEASPLVIPAGFQDIILPSTEREERLEIGWDCYTAKKVIGFPVPSQDVTYQTLPRRE